jgi:hypothetical protein
MDEGMLIRSVKNIKLLPSKGLIPVVYIWWPHTRLDNATTVDMAMAVTL